MKFSFGKVSSLYGDWRDWFIVDDQSLQKHPVKFYVNTEYAGTIPISIIIEDIVVEVIGECISKPIRIFLVRYEIPSLNKTSVYKFEPKFLSPGDTITIQFKLNFDIEEINND